MNNYLVIVSDNIGSGLARQNLHEVSAESEEEACKIALSEYERSRVDRGLITAVCADWYDESRG